MLDILKNNNRWKDYYNYKNIEVKLAVLVSVGLSAILWFLGIYDKLLLFIDDIQSLFLELIGAYIGIIGFALSGVAIIMGLFTENTIDKIEKTNGTGTFERMMSTFVFLAFNSAIGIVVTSVLYFALSSDTVVIGKIPFILVMYFQIYLTMFNIFYAVSLIAYCIKVFSIKRTYDKIMEKTFFNIANEIRIDFLIKILVDQCNVSPEALMEALSEAVNESTVKDKERLIQYYRKYYNIDKKKN